MELISQEALWLHFKGNNSAIARWAGIDRNTFKHQLNRGVVVVDGILYKKVDEVGELPEYVGPDRLRATQFKDLAITVYEQTGSINETAKLMIDGNPRTNRSEYNFWVRNLKVWVNEDESDNSRESGDEPPVL